MNLILRILHIIPFVHFYDKWSDTEECTGYGDNERQKHYCIICNKKQYRTVNNFTLLDQ